MRYPKQGWLIPWMCVTCREVVLVPWDRPESRKMPNLCRNDISTKWHHCGFQPLGCTSWLPGFSNQPRSCLTCGPDFVSSELSIMPPFVLVHHRTELFLWSTLVLAIMEPGFFKKGHNQPNEPCGDLPRCWGQGQSRRQRICQSPHCHFHHYRSPSFRSACVHKTWVFKPLRYDVAMVASLIPAFMVNRGVQTHSCCSPSLGNFCT